MIRPAVENDRQVGSVGEESIGPGEKYHPHLPAVVNGPGMDEKSGPMRLACEPGPRCQVTSRRVLDRPAGVP